VQRRGAAGIIAVLDTDLLGRDARALFGAIREDMSALFSTALALYFCSLCTFDFANLRRWRQTLG